MSDLLIESSDTPDEDGYVLDVPARRAGWEYVGFHVLRLTGEQSVSRPTGDREVCLVVLGGKCRVRTETAEWDDVGERASVFDGGPHSVYVPPGDTYTIEVEEGPLEVGVCAAPASKGAEPRVIRPEDIDVEIRGVGHRQREIRPILMEDREAERLFAVEVITPEGNWSSYPPHKHDRDDLPHESYLEETYYHRIDPPKGFGLQRVYNDDRSLDETFTLEDGDVVLVPEGYHTVSAPPGYEIYYLNAMAGPVRRWAIHNDPDHEWLIES